MGEMTKGEAIKYGTEWLKDEYLDAKDRAFIKIALEALEQEPCRYWQNGKCNGNTEVCEDAISRRAVLEIVEREQNKGDALSEIEKLPPVNPQKNIVNNGTMNITL